MGKTGKWRKILAILLTVSLTAGNGVLAFAGDENYVTADAAADRLEYDEILFADTAADEPEYDGILFSDAAADGGEWLAKGQEAVTEEVTEVTETGTTALRESGTLKDSGNASDAKASYLWMGSSSAFERCYGDQLTGVSRQIYDTMVSKWGSGKTGDITFKFTEVYKFKASLKGWKTSRAYTTAKAAIDKAVQSAYDAFIYDYPGVFWLSTIQYYSGMTLEDDGTTVEGTIKNVVLQSEERYSGAKSEVAAFDKAVSTAAAKIKKSVSSDSRYEIVKEIHDYLCETVDYGDNTSSTADISHTAAGVFLKNRVVVCEGYAKAFKILCDKFNIPCVLVVGFADGAHMWNYVKMDDGLWYLVDVTWDDQDEGIRYTYFLAGSQSPGFDGVTIAGERTAYTDFSGSGARSFILPRLSAKEYTNKTHSWKKVSKTAATCISYGSVVYQCSICGQKKTELLDKKNHSWGAYKSNKDATCLKDGTKTAACKYGCGATKTVTDTGSKLKPTITLNVTSVRLQTGQSTTKIKAGGLGKGDRIVSWKSNKTSVVTVKKKGSLGVTMTAKKAGTATITVTLKSGLKRSFKVTVQKAKIRTAKITEVPQSLSLKKGKSITLTPVISPVTSQEKVVYSSSDKKIATVSSKGVITAKKKGKAVITIKSGTITKKCKITVK